MQPNYPQYPQQGPPQGYPAQPPAQPGYTPHGYQQPGPPPGAAPGGMAGAPNLVTPTGGGEAKPQIRHLYGRAVAFVPTGYNPMARRVGAPKDSEDPTKIYAPEVTFDTYVFDGGPLLYGDKANGTPEEKAHKFRVETPCIIRGMKAQQTLIVAELQDKIGQAPNGRIHISEHGANANKPYKLDPFAPDDPASAIIAQLWGPMHGAPFPDGSHFTNPEPVKLDAAPAGPPPAQQWPAQPAAAPPAYPQQGYAPQGPPPGAQVQYGQQPVAPAPVAQPAPSAAPPQQPGHGQGPWGQPTNGVAAQQLPPGWTAEAWNALTPEQRAGLGG